LRTNNVASVIIGATKTSQIDENVKAAGVRLTSDAMSKIESILGQVSARH